MYGYRRFGRIGGHKKKPEDVHTFVRIRDVLNRALFFYRARL